MEERERGDELNSVQTEAKLCVSICSCLPLDGTEELRAHKLHISLQSKTTYRLTQQTRNWCIHSLLDVHTHVHVHVYTIM